MKKTTRKNLQFREKYGPYALVAGGSNGLGAAFAEALARRGLNLVLLAREKERLEASAKEIKKKYHVDAITFAVDLADYEKTKSIITGLTVSIGLLVYNAAFAPIGLFENTNEEHLSLAAAVNVKTPLLLAKLLSGQMINNATKGGIVLMSSLAGVQGSPKLAAYAATKAFNTVLAEGLWKELQPHGIDVIGCCAGAILTPGYQQAVTSTERATASKGSPLEKSKIAPGTLAACDVAEQTLKALGKGPVVVPGSVNKIARFVFTRLLTKKAAIGIMSKNTGGLS
ncbi:MAG: SDR family NAD(P)-dependent oxidoreductase [Treponema sp.]|nr:SDR family NAD(P)-dependent oxidoreductase [Treponema sp.]